MRLPPMMFQKMQRGDDFDQCPSCARILYYEAPADGGARFVVTFPEYRAAG
jgi:hypothetical protein